MTSQHPRGSRGHPEPILPGGAESWQDSPIGCWSFPSRQVGVDLFGAGQLEKLLFEFFGMGLTETDWLTGKYL